jgi:hypothetical protein
MGEYLVENAGYVVDEYGHQRKAAPEIYGVWLTYHAKETLLIGRSSNARFRVH